MVASTKNKELTGTAAGQKVPSLNTATHPDNSNPGVVSNQTYVESDAVKLAKDQLSQQLAQKPGAYQSQWQTSLNDTMNKILNREKFSYDLNGDALYQQYKDQYINQGQMAMMDTMGQAQAMTGGYGNSYAQSVGQQTYQGYLQGLNDKVPELYQLALNQYNQEGDALLNQYGLMADRENQEYGRYRDSVSDWNTEQNRLYQQYLDERSFDYGKYADDRSFQYQQERDQVADQQWQTQFDEALRQYNEQFSYQQNRDQISDQQWKDSFQYQQDRDKTSDEQWSQSLQYQQDRDKIADQQWQAQFDEAKRQFDHQNGIDSSTNSTNSSSSSTSSSSTGNTGYTSTYDDHGYTKEEIMAIQKRAGITADGIWGPQTEKAYNMGYRPTNTPYTPVTEPTAYETAEKDLNGYIKNGASKSEINTYLRLALNDGDITQAEYQKLKAQYAPAGNTY